MIQTFALFLGRFLQLPFLQGYRTQLSAIGLIGLAIYLLFAGQAEAGLTNLFFALGLLGIRFRFTPDRPVLPGGATVEPSPQDIEDQAILLESLMPDADPPQTTPQATMGFIPNHLRNAQNGLVKDNRQRRRARRQAVVEGLQSQGVSGSTIALWLPIIIALLQAMPEIAAIIQKIMDALGKKKTPAQFAAEEKLSFAGR